MSRRGLTVAALESLYRERYDHFVRVAAALAGDGEAGRAPVRRWVALGVAALTVVALVAVASPLGAAIAHELGDFSAWLSGQPGSPVSKREQRAFDRANERSWLGFPAGTRLRSLITSEDASSGRRVELLGFRSGSTLCLRVDVSGQTRASTTSCAPLEELRQAGAPVRVGLADAGFGKGTKRAWYGIDRYAAPAIQVTAGIAADGVRSVIVEDASGRHTLRARSNAFLYVASNPDVGQRVTRIWARTGHGLVAIPFAPAPFGFGAGSSTRRPDRGPTRVERRVHDGTISWLDRRDPRGQPLEVLPPRLRKMVQHDAVFGRVVAPDPRRPVRVALTLSTSRHGGKAIGLCSWLISTGGHPGGGCAVRADLFATSPITADLTVTKSSDEFVTMYGLASDDVARIVAFPATGASTDVPLNDNVYVVDVARSRLLVRLVAYDTAGHVIGMTLPPGDFFGGPEPARGRAQPLLRARSSNGGSAELLVGKSTTGGRCMYVRYDTNQASGTMVSCREVRMSDAALQLSGSPRQRSS